MPRFRYLLDPVFLAVVSLYFANRSGIKPYCESGFFHSYFNDLICIPFTVPPILWILRKLNVRRHDRPPSAGEITVVLLVFAAAFEVVFPATAILNGATVSDPWDVGAYTVGGIVSWLIWNQCFRNRSASRRREARS